MAVDVPGKGRGDERESRGGGRSEAGWRQTDRGAVAQIRLPPICIDSFVVLGDVLGFNYEKKNFFKL